MYLNEVASKVNESFAPIKKEVTVISVNDKNITLHGPCTIPQLHFT